jgi:hypothetical protein
MSHVRTGIYDRADYNKRRAAISATFWHSRTMLAGFSDFANDLIALIPDQKAVDQLIATYEPRWERVEHAFSALSCLAAGDITDYERLVETGREGLPTCTLRGFLFGEPEAPASPAAPDDSTRVEVSRAHTTTGELRS